MKCGSDATADSQRKAKPKLTMLIKLGSASHVRELSKHAPPQQHQCSSSDDCQSSGGTGSLFSCGSLQPELMN